MAQKKTHYELLGVPQSASAAEVKAAYHQAALQLHPDKAATAVAAAAEANGDGERGGDASFHALQVAWEALREPASRARYDRQLSQAALRAMVALQDELTLDELDAADEEEGGGDDGGGESVSNGDGGAALYTYPCRCGDSYELSAAELRGAGGEDVLVPCRSCSNHILVKLGSSSRGGGS